MKIFRTKVWSPVDVILLKWCCLFFGCIAGAYFSEFIKTYVWLFLVAAILLAIKPAVSYFRDK